MVLKNRRSEESRCSKQWLALSLSLSIFLQLSSLKANAQGTGAQNYDLGSQQGTAVTTATTGPVAISVGGASLTVQQGSLLTPAEQVAVNQVLSSGQQSIVISAQGTAIGGTVNLGTDFGSGANNLVIPQGVTALGNFSHQSTLAITGNLINYGNLFAYSSSAGSTSGILSAANITNQQNALISSVLPANLSSALGAIPQFNLTLVAAQNLVNSGIISSSGNLSIVAGNSIINSSTSNVSALIQALGNVNLTASNIVNSGAITALTGNINLQSQLLSNLTVNNSGGILQALSGNIMLSSPLAAISDVIDLRGGDFLSRELNIDAGHGFFNGQIGEVTGWVNINAGSTAFGAASTNLHLGSINVNGDPTFFNTVGSLTLANISNTAGANLALIARGDVVVNGGTIDTTNSAGGSGGHLTVIAGANVSSSGGSSGASDTGTTLTLTQSALAGHGSVSGGAIDLSAVTSVNTQATLTLNGTGGNGGNVLLVAFSGDGSASSRTPGSINLGSSGVITTAGAGSNGTNGSITVIAGATQDPVSVPAVNLPAMFTGASATFSQSGTGGDVSIFTATPNISGSVTIKDGAITFGAVDHAASAQPTSIALGSRGGGSVISLNSSDAWQVAAASYALAQINLAQAAKGLGPLQSSPMLDLVAQNEAEYMAATNHFAHYNLQGGSPVDRATLEGINPQWTGCCAENIAFATGGGMTAKTSFDVINSGMFAEPNVAGTHAYNLLHNTYVGIGFANVGGTFYVVEDFSLYYTGGAAKSTVDSAPVRGGVAGQAGLVPTTSGNLGLGAMGGNNLLPTSIFAGGNVLINCGNTISATGQIMANGISGLQGAGQINGTNAGIIDISAISNITLFNLQAVGGTGGSNQATSQVANAGAGGLVSVTSQNGNIKILPGGACAPCLSISVAGGGGGQALIPGTAGGAGGDGGTITLSAAKGTIDLTAIDASGGGGAGGAGGVTGGIGGAGGAGGTITISAANLNIRNYVSASGGGGGGAGGQVASGGSGGGGGGGGSFGISGFGGAAGNSTSGGGGGGGAQVGQFGGPSSALTVADVSSGNGLSGTTGAGGAAGAAIGAGGKGGNGAGAQASTGGTGGSIGAAGSSDSKGFVAGGAAGSGGTVSLTASAIFIQGTVSNFWGSTAVTHGSASISAVGPNGSVTITGAAGGAVSVPAVYAADGNFSSTTRNVPVSLTGTLTVGGIEAGTQPGAIIVNGTQFNSPIGNGISGPASVTLAETGAGQVAFTGNTVVTPAELVAIIQKVSGTQLLTLDNQGKATGGDFTIAAANVPVGGFSSISIPSAVIAHVNVPVLSATDISIGAGAKLELNGAATINTPVLNVLGSVESLSGNLTVQSTGPAQTLTLSFGPSAKIQTTAGSVLFNGNIAGSISTVSSGVGSIVAGGTGSLVSFNGGASAVSVSVQSITGAVSGSGSPFSVTVSGSTPVVLGSLNAVASSLTIAAPGGITQAAGTTITASSLSLSSGAGSISLGLGGASSGALNADAIQISTATGSVNIADGVALTLLPSTIGGQFNISDSVSITTSGNTSFVSGVITTPLFNNSFTLTATGSSGTNLALNGPQGQNLIVSGNGTMNASAMSFSASDGLGFLGNQTLNASAVTLTALGVEVATGSTLTVHGNLTVNAAVLFNPSGLSVSGTSTLNLGSSGSTLGVLANSSGDVVLSSSTLVNSGGKNLAIIASGNVSGNLYGSINLSSSQGTSGNLTVIAGANFTPLTVGQVVDNTSEFVIIGASSTGGSINLSNISIDTSNGSASNRGGSVTMLTMAGAQNAGVIVTGALNTSSQHGAGGTVKLIGAGGIAVNGSINTAGELSGGAVILSGTGFSAGQIRVKSALLSPIANIQPLSPTDGSGAAISVTGSINTASTAGIAGGVNVTAEAQVALSSIITSGLASSGSVTVSSLNGYVSIAGDVNTSAFGISATGSSATGGRGGDFILTVPQFATISGNIITTGGNTSGTGAGGAGGSVSLSTSTRDNALGLFTGNVAINGFVNISGGAARTTAGGGAGGPAGQLSITAGALQVRGTSYLGLATSIAASGGLGAAGTGAPGAVLLKTYAVQPLPSNFNLTSNMLTEVALPGGVFTIGGYNIVNGTAAAIVSGANSASSTNASSLSQGTFSQGAITITVTGGSQSINVGGVNKSIAPLTGGNRTQITPAQALALYQVSLGGNVSAQTVGLNGSGQLTALNPQTGLGPSTLTVPEFDLPVSFGAFVIAATGNANGMALNITGARPVINLSSASSVDISGKISFSTPNSAGMFYAGYSGLVTASGASITSGGDLITTSSITNNGSLSAGRLVVLNPGGAFSLQNNASGTLTAAAIIIPSNGPPINTTITNQGGSMTAPLVFAQLTMPTVYGQPAVSSLVELHHL